MASDIQPPSSKREKVVLKKGFHLTDWMRLVQSVFDLSGRNGGPLRNIGRDELRKHNTEYDCWTAYNGKVYNITPYLHYHPGGINKLLEGAAGQDCTVLFNKYHAWVNIQSMIGKCLVGNYIPHLSDPTSTDASATAAAASATDATDCDDSEDEIDHRILTDSKVASGGPAVVPSTGADAAGSEADVPPVMEAVQALNI